MVTPVLVEPERRFDTTNTQSNAGLELVHKSDMKW